MQTMKTYEHSVWLNGANLVRSLALSFSKNLQRPFVLVNRRCRNRIDYTRLSSSNVLGIRNLELHSSISHRRLNFLNDNKLASGTFQRNHFYHIFYSYCLQTIMVGNSFKKLYQKLVLRVSSGIPNTSKQ